MRKPYAPYRIASALLPLLCAVLLWACGLCPAQAEESHTHDFVDGTCTVCGVEMPEISVIYTGGPLTKVYDKTRNVALDPDSFSAEGDLASDLSITKFEGSYDAPDAGNRTVNATVTLVYDGEEPFMAKVTVQIPAVITPKALVITPHPSQKKLYGAADPSYYTGMVKGLFQGDTITGKLSREPGEAVGSYRILIGTVDAGNNYEIQMDEEYFTIETKGIDDSDVALASISNQRFTGAAIEPAVTLIYNKYTLVRDTDYEVAYSDNIAPGTATVTITGKGSFTGTRTTTFRILSTFTDVSRVVVQPDVLVYTGTPLEPGVTWYVNDIEMEEYTVVYANNYRPGKAKVLIMDANDSIQAQASFTILDPDELNVFTLPTELKQIGADALRDTQAQMVVVPDSCEEIADGAFADCDGLIDIYIPASVTGIAPGAFSDRTDFTIRTPTDSDAAKFAKANGIFWYAP